VAPPPPACTLPNEVAITLHGSAVFVDGAPVEELSRSAERPTALTRLLVPCVARPNHLRESDALEGKHDNDFGVLKVSGRLAPEVIQRVVRNSYWGFRKCYELGLGRNPTLEGRVTARFVIGLDGTVTNAANGGSDLDDPEVVRCIIVHFYTIRFPPPDGGIVTVVYPIMLSPG
jgi:hypothetical protein